MSMKPYYYVMYGAAIPRSDFPGDPYDDKWLPFTEGHEGVEMSIHDGGSNENIYCGKVLAETDPYGDFECKNLEFDEATQTRVKGWLFGHLAWSNPPKLMLVCLWL